jgi:hypothetical protein
LTGAAIAAERLKESRRPADGQSQREGPAMEVGGALQQLVGVDRGDEKSDRQKTGQRHVPDLCRRRRIPERGEGVDVDGLSIGQRESRRGVHPGVGRHDEKPESAPLARTTTPDSQWARGETLSQP